ncbi:MAG TPA: ABC transporter ATP-binding protein [Rhodothermales bacterium]|nr:ABC transporter ATP-binding protein [Rhodothermales bacterium]
MASISLQAEALEMRFGRRLLFRNLNIEASSGEFLAITGQNGSGKSTLMRILAGILAPTAGKVQLLANGVELPERPFFVGLVAPYLNLYEGFTLRENMRFVARVRGLDTTTATEEALIQKVQLQGRADELVGNYSSGMKQRARFGLALLTNPPILILDEPTANLDDSGKAFVWNTIEEARTSGKLVLMATNEVGEAERADRQVKVERPNMR